MISPSDRPNTAQAAVAIIRTAGPNPEFLILKRAANPIDPWSGHFALPGGRRDPADADLLDTAIREAYEECAIQLSRDHLVQVLPGAVAGGWRGKPMVVSPFLFEVTKKPKLELQEKEIAEYHWISLNYLRDPGNHGQEALSPQDPNRLFPYIRVAPRIPLPAISGNRAAMGMDSRVIWGFTYGVLTSFLESH